MAPRPIPPEVLKLVRRDLAEGKLTRDEIATKFEISQGKVSNIKAAMMGLYEESPAPAVDSDKKVGDFDWEEWTDWIEQGQELRHKASFSQKQALITLGDGSRPVILFQLGDMHIGSWATDYKILKTITKEIQETDGLYVALMGDLVEMAIKMRSVLEVTSQILPPEQQMRFLESWLEGIWDKVAFSTWCNHAVEREEKMTGISSIKNLLSRKSVYFNGIGHPDIKVGDQVYTIAASHRFRGKSMYDSTFGPKRYGRMEGHDREIMLQADLHDPAVSTYINGGKKKISITSGTLVLNSGYAERYFSLFTFPIFPCIVLRHDRHEAIPFWNLAEAQTYLRG
jgi:hypothetical protein